MSVVADAVGRLNGLRRRGWIMLAAVLLVLAAGGSAVARPAAGVSRPGAADLLGAADRPAVVGVSGQAAAGSGRSAAVAGSGKPAVAVSRRSAADRPALDPEQPAAQRPAASAPGLLVAAAQPASITPQGGSVSGQLPAIAGQPAPGATTYSAPIAGPLRVLRPFDPPPTPYAAGHRGVDLAAPPTALVLAAADGRVTFAGSVAGRGVVVIAHPDGIRTEYEPVAPMVASGQAVSRGQPIARLRGQHDRCPPGQCLHWGARRGDAYVDPMSLLRPLGPVRLLPWPR